MFGAFVSYAYGQIQGERAAYRSQAEWTAAMEAKRLAEIERKKVEGHTMILGANTAARNALTLFAVLIVASIALASFAR